jgi:hypothetical protein
MSRIAAGWLGRTGHMVALFVGAAVLPCGTAGAQPIADRSPGNFVATSAASFLAGPLAVRRASHTATLLPSGEVLAVGGFGGEPGSENDLVDAELYDPSRGRWNTTGSLAQARDSHTATLLPNGKVLVAGGFGGSAALASAELYDPSEGSWAGTGPLGDARYAHTATLLPQGKLLVVGGFGGGVALDSAEIYDPEHKTWTTTASLAESRHGHTATRLRDGSVLVVGGFGHGKALATVELYDPEGGTWSPVGSLEQARYLHTATLLADGRVLVAGGFDGGGSLASAEIYDPEMRAWTRTGPLNEARDSHPATLLPNGMVLVAGGYRNGTVLNSVEIYDPALATWSFAHDTSGDPVSLVEARAYHTATLLPQGEVLFVGGYGGLEYLASAERYDPADGSWAGGQTLDHARESHTATLLPDGTLLIAGGFEDTGYLAIDERYDPAVPDWAPTGSLRVARASHTATLLATGEVLVAGGLGDAGTLASAELYNPGSGTWRETGPLLQARVYHTATPLPNGKVLLVGGLLDGTIMATAELYDPETGKSASTGSLSRARHLHTATLLPNGTVLVAGGFGTGGYLGSAELYDPETETWTPTGPLAEARHSHTATLLADGTVLVTGGSVSTGYTRSSEVYDPATGTWRRVDSLTDARANQSATLLPNGKVLAAGGMTSEGYAASAEVYDPVTATWTVTRSLSEARAYHTATLLSTGRVLAAGGIAANGFDLSGVELYDLNLVADARRPVITEADDAIAYGTRFSITGTGFRGDSEADGGTTNASPVNYPLLQARSLLNDQVAWLRPDPRDSFFDDPMPLTVSPPSPSCPSCGGLPPTLDYGWQMLTVVNAGVSSVGRLVPVTCKVAIAEQPTNATVAIGAVATFQVTAQGARRYQWEKDATGKDEWAIIPGATGPSYTTAPVTAADSGSRYRVVVNKICPGATATSDPAILIVADSDFPTAKVLSPSGGEYLLLSEPGSAPNTHLITWSMSDNIRICSVAVSLVYFNESEQKYVEAPAGGGLPQTFGPGWPCGFPGEDRTSMTYELPTEPPSGTVGSLYKIKVVVTDHAGHPTKAESQGPFYMVKANPDSVRTLILSNTARMKAKMGISSDDAKALDGSLKELADNPRVLGLVVDLDGLTDLSELYRRWDGETSNPDLANNVLFGCHDTLLRGCEAGPELNGVHDQIRALLGIYTGVKYVVLVGDDRIIPMARVTDHASLFTEMNYPKNGDLTPDGTTVGQALAADRYLSDDPLVVLDAVRSDGLSGNLYLPDLGVGRLVEMPSEITKTIATFISQDGVLDLTDAKVPNKVLVTGYEFLTDSARRICDRWKSVFPLPSDRLDCDLIGDDWGFPSQEERAKALKRRLAGRYGVASLSGHATHFEEGVPGDSFELFGLPTTDMLDLDLSGRVIYAVGCHGGLPVPATPLASDHSLDLPQTFLRTGVEAYVANSGFGWGLKHGIGYGERLTLLLTQELTKGGTIFVGDAVRQTKLKYYAQTPRYDSYDEKTLMQWTFFGLPMYRIKTGIPTGNAAAPSSSPSFAGPAPRSRPAIERFGGVTVKRDALAAGPETLPFYLTQLNLRFDFTAPGVYDKRNAAGDKVNEPGCKDQDGCYYTLNGLASGSADLPIQPYFIYDSRLSGTSQHGVLWKGGTYDEETSWVPVMAELQSNGGDGSDHGDTPRLIKIRPVAPRIVPGLDPDGCRPSDLEINSTVVDAGEALKVHDTDPTFTIERRHRTVDLEAFYFNNTVDGSGNCDRVGPTIVSTEHQVAGGTITWAIHVTDDSDVWRVLVVVNDNVVDTQGRGSWVPVELAFDGAQWTGSHALVGSTQATYVVQAVDRRGNVSWATFTAVHEPSSGVPLGVPLPTDVRVAPSTVTLSIDDVVTTEPVSGQANASFTVSLSEPRREIVTVRYATRNGTATSGTDYLAQAGTLTFQPGDRQRQVDVPVLADRARERAETFFVDLSGATVSIAKARGRGLIIDRSVGPRVQFSAANYSVPELAGAAVITVTRTDGESGMATVGYETSNGTATAGATYRPASGVLTFGPGVLSRSFTVAILSGALHERDQTVLLRLKDVRGATLGAPSTAVLTITDNHRGTVQFLSETTSVKRSRGKAVVAVMRSGGTASDVTVDVEAVGGTAEDGIDYAASLGRLSFASGNVQHIEVALLDGALRGDRTLKLVLENPSAGAELGGNASTTLVILSDEPVVQFGAPTYSVAEGDRLARIVVKRSGPRSGTLTVDYATGDGTATPGVDYEPAAGTLTFGPGVAARTFTVRTKDSHEVEDSATVKLTLSNPQGGATLGVQDQAVLTITTDDPALRFSLPSYSVTETSPRATITVKRTGPATRGVGVHYGTSDGTARDGVEYQATSGDLTFKPGVVSLPITVPILKDVDHVTGQTVNLTLTSPTTGARLGSPASAVLTIVDSDAAGAVQFEVSNFSVSETDPSATITVVRKGGRAGGGTVDYATEDGSAEEGKAYQATTGTLTFGDGETSQRFTVPVVDTGSTEKSRTVRLVLRNATGGLIVGERSTASLWIVSSH